MQGIWWKLPLLRALSPLGRGALMAISLVVLVTFGSMWAVHQSASEPSPGLCSTLAQLGATLLVAFVIETGSLIRGLGRRGRNPETLVGLLSGLGSCGLFGVAVAWSLSQHSGALQPLEEIGFAWSIGSIGLLGGLVAVMPYMMYDWVHAARTEYPDE
jgi:hypothetical protein